MHDAFILLMIGVLVAAVISFAIMGLLQRRRTRRLARKAHEMGMRFSPDDPFNVPRRYAGFAMIGCGHSPRASNVTYGRLDGQPIRAFDFRYEVGHGTRRLTRHYSVIVCEADSPMRPLLMWHEQDAECAPLALHGSDRRVACWRYAGSQAGASALAAVFGPLAEEGLSLQISGTAVMFCVPKRRRNQAYSDRLGDLAAIAARIPLLQAGAAAGGND